MRSRFGGLWQHPDFVRLWAAQTVSLFGSQVTFIALPLTAVLALEATPVQMGILGAIQYVPVLLLGLFAGAWVDRHRRRPILIAADVGRALLLLSIPVASWLGVLRMELLYAVALLVGSLTVFFDVASVSFLPSLVQREHLVEGNGKLAVSQSAAQIAGPGFAGGLVQLLTAPVAIAVDAFSFLASALFLGFIRTHEIAPPARERWRGIGEEIGEGLQMIVGNPLLRAIAGASGTWNLFGNVLFAVFVLYVTRDLTMDAGLLGLIFASGSVGFLLSASVANYAAQRLGLGSTMIGALLLGGIVRLLIPLASGPAVVAMPLLVGAWFLSNLGLSVYNVNVAGLRQAVTPDRLQGRVSATIRFIGWGTVPLGALIGGVLGETIGLRATLIVGATGGLLPFLWAWFSPLRTLHEPLQPPA
jgi:MFS family permease